jgi:MAF protein
MKIYLASKSKARKQLLEKFDLKFKILAAQVKERSRRGNLSYAGLVRENAKAKAEAAALQVEEGVIIAADTICVQDGKIFGKPRNIPDARRMLKQLSRKPQWLYTGLAVIKKSKTRKKLILDHEKTKVYMDQLNSRQIDNYFKQVSPLDKAGSFDVQGKGAFFIKRIDGCFYSVVGLPLRKLYLMFKKLKLFSFLLTTTCYLLATLFLAGSSTEAAEILRKENTMNNPAGLRSANLDNPFGVLEFLHWNHAWNHYKYPNNPQLEKAISLMQRAGVGWVRLDFLWEDIEAQEGKFDFAKYDNLVTLISEKGINILGVLHYSPDWASSCGEWNCPPKDNAAFVNYASKVIQRYKGQVTHWELWNEPDSETYWKPQDGLKAYCVLLKEVYVAAKKIDPDCKILNGGLANGLGSINHLYENGAKGYFDILNIHFFQNPAFGENAIKAVASYPRLAYKIMERNGDADKQIWLTEIGCPGVKAGIPVNNWWLGKNPDERQQAQWVKQVYGELLKNPRVQKIFWAFFRDTQEHWDSGVDYFGLIRWDFSPKPSFKAYQECFELWQKDRAANSGNK